MIESALQKDQAILPKPKSLTSGFRAALVVGGLSLFTAAVLLLSPLSSVGLESSQVLWVGGGLLAALCLALGLGRTRASNAQNAVFVLWGFLLISEGFFSRVGTVDEAFAGSFNVAAYGEAIIWILSLLILIPLMLGSPLPIQRLFSTNYKWVAWFGALCVVSCAYSPRPAFSAAWALKLCVVIMLVHLCSAYINDLHDLDGFLRLTFWALAFLVIHWVIQGDGTHRFFNEEGRLYGSNGLSASAGTLIVLGLTLYSARPGWGLKRAPIFIGLIAFIIMVVAGGKAGALAGLISALLFFILRKGIGSAALFLSVALIIGALAIALSPMGRYLETYSQEDQLTTLTGRTPLWEVAIPAIIQKPILGHGYVSSAFVSVVLNGVPWQAEHMHNGFLEALYNTGIIGFALILVIHVIIARNLIRVVRHTQPDSYLYQLGVGCLAFYVNLLINGFANASFAGRAWHPFMLLIALVVISNKLVEVSNFQNTRRDEAFSV
jgi:O-Antigen ligase